MGKRAEPSADRQTTGNAPREWARSVGCTFEGAFFGYVQRVSDFQFHLAEVSTRLEDGSDFIPTPIASLTDRWEQVVGAAYMIWIAVHPPEDEFEMVDRTKGRFRELKPGPFRDLSQQVDAIRDLPLFAKHDEGWRVTKHQRDFISKSIELLLRRLTEVLTREELGDKLGRLAASLSNEGSPRTSQVESKPNDLCTLSDATELIPRSRNTIQSWIEQELICSYRDGNHGAHLVSRKELLALAASKGIHPPH